METVGVRNYRFSDDEVASIVVGTANMYVIVKTSKWLFTMCPKIEINDIPLVVYCRDLSQEYNIELLRLYREEIGIAVDESTYYTYNELTQKDLQRRYVDNYNSISSDTVKHWADRILNKTQMERVNTVVILKLNESTFVQVLNNKEHFLTQNNNEVFTFIYDGSDCCITSLYEAEDSSLVTRLGALALNEVSDKDRYHISFQNRLVIGNAFRTYHESVGKEPRSDIWCEPL